MVWGRAIDNAQKTAQFLRSQGVNAVATSSLERACGEADVISCATLASQSLLRGEWLKAGTHVDLVGAFTPTMREADDRVFERASAVWCDTTAGALAEAGDILQALASGALDRGRMAGELSDLCRAVAAPARAEQDITVFKSVGAALEDLAAARLCLDLLDGAAGARVG